MHIVSSLSMQCLHKLVCTGDNVSTGVCMQCPNVVRHCYDIMVMHLISSWWTNFQPYTVRNASHEPLPAVYGNPTLVPYL